MTFNRRSFLKAGLAAAVTAPVAGVHAVEYSSKIKFDKTARRRHSGLRRCPVPVPPLKRTMRAPRS